MQVNSTFLKKALLKKGAKIKIKKSNKGKFTDYCGGKVTLECIDKGKHSPDPKIRKRATFALNARAWKHLEGGPMVTINGQKDLEYWKKLQELLGTQLADYLKKLQELLEKAQQQLQQEIQKALEIGSTIGKIGGMAMNLLNSAIVQKRDKKLDATLNDDPNKKQIIDDLMSGLITLRGAKAKLAELGYHGPLTTNMLDRYIGRSTYTYDANLTAEENKQNALLFEQNKQKSRDFLHQSNKKQALHVSELQSNLRLGEVTAAGGTNNSNTVYPEGMQGYVESANEQFSLEREKFLKENEEHKVLQDWIKLLQDNLIKLSLAAYPEVKVPLLSSSDIQSQMEGYINSANLQLNNDNLSLLEDNIKRQADLAAGVRAAELHDKAIVDNFSLEPVLSATSWNFSPGVDPRLQTSFLIENMNIPQNQSLYAFEGVRETDIKLPENILFNAQLRNRDDRSDWIKHSIKTKSLNMLPYNKKGGLISKKVHDPFHTKSILDDTGMVDRKTLKLKKHGK